MKKSKLLKLNALKAVNPSRLALKAAFMVLVLVMGMTFKSFSQNTIIPTTGSNTMTANGTLCTSPGCGSTYANNANGYTVLSNPGNKIINIYSASSSVETSNDYVRIYSGTGTGGTLLYTFNSQPGTINYTGAVGLTLTVQFTSDAGTGFTGLNATVTFMDAPPTISSFTPTSGAVGATVTIAGTNFNTTPANNAVYFGATKATVSAATTTSLTVTVPAGANYQ